MQARSAEVAAVPAHPVDSTGYLLLAADVDGHAGPPSEAKRRLLDELKSRVPELRRDMFACVLVFTAARLWAERGDDSAQSRPRPRYDLAILIQAPTIESASWLSSDPAFIALHDLVRATARATSVTVTYNTRGDVCEYGPRLPRVYLLMRYADPKPDDVAPGWGWTNRRHLVADLLFNRRLRRYLRARPATGSLALYRLA